MREMITGNMAAAIGAKLCRPQVVSAYPITPQTTIIEYLAKMVADKELVAEFIKVESEHSAMASLIGAAAAGSRVFTATSSQGLLLMHEMLWQASGLRLPIVMVNVNRAVGAPWNIWTEQTDSLAQRDTGWLQFYCENSQEVLDTIIMSYKIAEEVSLPVMIVSEGFVLSHTSEPVEIPDQEQVDEFLGHYNPKWKLDVSNPMAFGADAKGPLYSAMRRSIHDSMIRSIVVYQKVSDDFFQIFKRRYWPIEVCGSVTNNIILVSSGIICGTIKDVIENTNHNFHKNFSLMKIRMFRPFFSEWIRSYVAGGRSGATLGIIDRSVSFGSRGIIAEAMKSGLYKGLCDYYSENPRVPEPEIFEFIVGLGGTDVTPKTIDQIMRYMARYLSEGLKAPRYPIWQEDLKDE